MSNFLSVGRSLGKATIAQNNSLMTSLPASPLEESPKSLESPPALPFVSDDLLPEVYAELRRLAAWKMSSEPGDHTLQPTALVHEAYLRLLGQDNPRWQNRAHFFGAAAEAMRRILIERARRKSRVKHGGGQTRASFDEIEVAIDADEDTLLFVSEALDKLAAMDPVCAELVKLRFFAGVPNHRAAEMLGLSERTAKRNWAYARAWLKREISSQMQ